MGSQINSVNMFELLGNDHDEDSDKEPEPPTKVVDKPLPRTSKRNVADPSPRGAGAGAPDAGGDTRGGRGGRRGGFTGSEEAFRDRAAGSVNNRGKPTGDGAPQDRQSSRGDGHGRGRGRGATRGRGAYGDRHSHIHGDTEKRVAQSWGATKGESEYADEKAGEAIARAEGKADGLESSIEAAVDADGKALPGADKEGTATAAATAATAAATPVAEPEVEDNSMSYTDYVAEQAQKRLDSGLGLSQLSIRKPNENVKQDKKWAAAKELKRADPEEEAFIAGAAQKAKRERQRKEKTVIDIDQRFVEPSGGRGGYDGGRGGRGGRGRGEGRGGSEGRGGRGGPRGGRGGDFNRGGGNEGRPFRGGRAGPSINTQDTSAFPSLGKS